LGLILYLMFHYQKHLDTPMKRLSLSLPWIGKNPIDVLNNIKTKPLAFKCEKMPEEIKEIVTRMLTIDVEKRMSFREFLEIKMFQTNQKKLEKVIPVNMKSSLVDLELSESFNYSEYELTLINECTRQPQFLRRETVDFELLKLLEIKDSEEYE
jgi:serine/threonine protein kinase